MKQLSHRIVLLVLSLVLVHTFNTSPLLAFVDSGSGTGGSATNGGSGGSTSGGGVTDHSGGVGGGLDNDTGGSASGADTGSAADGGSSGGGIHSDAGNGDGAGGNNTSGGTNASGGDTNSSGSPDERAEAQAQEDVAQARSTLGRLIDGTVQGVKNVLNEAGKFIDNPVSLSIKQLKDLLGGAPSSPTHPTVDNDLNGSAPTTGTERTLSDGEKAALERAKVAELERSAVAKRVAEATAAKRAAEVARMMEINADGVAEAEKVARQNADIAAAAAKRNVAGDITAAEKKVAEAEQQATDIANAAQKRAANAVTGAAEAVENAKTALELAQTAVQNVSIDSQQMFAYADALKRYNTAVTNLDTAKTSLENGTPAEATQAANAAVKEAQDSIKVSDLVNDPDKRVDAGSGSGIVENFNPNDQSLPRGIRNNNPGNLESVPSNSWLGKILGIDPRFETFTTPEAGIRAMVKVLDTYQSKYGASTIQEVIEKWAPPTENNTKAYVDTVAEKVGISPNAPIDISANPKVAVDIVRAIIGYENGVQPYSDAQIQAGYKAAYDNSLPTASAGTGSFMDFDKYVEDQKKAPPLSGTGGIQVEKPTKTGIGKVVDTIKDLITHPLDSIGNMLDHLFSGDAAQNPTTSNNTKDDHKKATSTVKTPVVQGPTPATDLYAVATGVTETGRVTTTTAEYRFAGYIGRLIILREDGLPVSDINANYADTVFTKLSVDYHCDGTVDATSIFPIAYSAFDPLQDTSKVLVSSYLQLTQTGTHCYFFDTDVNDVVLEKSEVNNKSNVYMFIVDDSV